MNILLKIWRLERKWIHQMKKKGKKKRMNMKKRIEPTGIAPQRNTIWQRQAQAVAKWPSSL